MKREERTPPRPVTIFLPKEEDGDGVLEVGVNGRMYLIRRGEEARVSPWVMEVLRHAGLIKGEAQ